MLAIKAYVLGEAEGRGNATAVVDGTSGERLSSHELAGRAASAATGLAAWGVRPGDAVGLVAHNSPRYAVAVRRLLKD